MKSLVDPSSSSNSTIIFCFSVAALLMISINTPICLCDDDDSQQYTNCNAAFSCGFPIVPNLLINNLLPADLMSSSKPSIPNFLKYPFWGVNRARDCGVQELTCEGNVPKITLNEVKYRILDWDNTTQMLKVARDDYWFGDVCGVSNNNSTFDNTLFQRAGHISNVTLLYNCDHEYPNSSLFHTVHCDVYNISYSNNPDFDLHSTYLDLCNPFFSVVIPVSGVRHSSDPRTSNVTDFFSLYRERLQMGFDLKYTGRGFVECLKCVDSGGVCGNNEATGFTCFCKDGPQTNTTTCSSNSQNPTSTSTSSSKWTLRLIVIGASVAGFGLLIVISFIVVMSKRGIGGQKWIFWRPIKFENHNDKAFNQRYDMIVAKRYSSAQVKSITNSFRDKLGDGGFAIVYKGCLPDGRHVAVKVIRESKGNEEDFINEVASICSTSHRNIVSLLGFCYEMNERALIFEFMPKGSLDKFIYRSGFPNAICDFDWNILFQIAIGIARGLEYLHQGCASRILHLDIKPQNILLDEDFCPKISDFGLAKICKKKESIVSIPGTRGTPGYIAPEVFSRAFGRVSDKSDVYSYGMLVLEMIGGRNNHDTKGSRSTEMYFPDWIYKDLEQGNTGVSWLAISEKENDMVRKITMVSLWCIQTNPLDRPSMKKVIEWLEGPLQLVPYPPNPSLYSPERPPLQISSTSSGSLYETNSITT